MFQLLLRLGRFSVKASNRLKQRHNAWGGGVNQRTRDIIDCHSFCTVDDLRDHDNKHGNY